MITEIVKAKCVKLGDVVRDYGRVVAIEKRVDVIKFYFADDATMCLQEDVPMRVVKKGDKGMTYDQAMRKSKASRLVNAYIEEYGAGILNGKSMAIIIGLKGE